MLETNIESLSSEDPGLETPAETRERLKDRFPRNASRRMTQLGHLVGATLQNLSPIAGEPVVYASAWAETRALEAFLDSFPSPSPTLFQTSIHPSGVQQALVANQRPVREFFPMTGSLRLVARALEVALLCDAPRTLLCGGEERGTWMLEHDAASSRTFAFALALTRRQEGSIGRIRLEPHASPVQSGSRAPSLSLPEFFDLLRTRSPFSGLIASGQWLTLSWF